MSNRTLQYSLHYGSAKHPVAEVVPDKTYPGMWRMRWPDGRVSDMANLTRAKDAVACFGESLERKRRGRQRSRNDRTCVKASHTNRSNSKWLKLRWRY